MPTIAYMQYKPQTDLLSNRVMSRGACWWTAQLALDGFDGRAISPNKLPVEALLSLSVLPACTSDMVLSV